MTSGESAVLLILGGAFLLAIAGSMAVLAVLKPLTRFCSTCGKPLTPPAQYAQTTDGRYHCAACFGHYFPMF